MMKSTTSPNLTNALITRFESVQNCLTAANKCQKKTKQIAYFTQKTFFFLEKPNRKKDTFLQLSKTF